MDTFTLEQLDFSEIQRAMDEILNQSFSFRDTVLSLLSGEQPFTLESFFRTALTEAGRSFTQDKQIFVSILVLGIAAALLKNFTDVFKNDQIGEISFERPICCCSFCCCRYFPGRQSWLGRYSLRCRSL